jgi:predicted transcriptional regulator
MKLSDIAGSLEAKVVAGQEELDRQVDYAFASDLMSDVLTLERDRLVLITGLSNVQAIRTAEMSDISAVILARNKKAGIDMIHLAGELGIVLMESKWSMFRIAGELYKAGVKPVF